MGVTYPPPRGHSSQNKKSGSIVKVCNPQLRHVATTWQVADQLQRLLSSSELEAKVHDVFTEDGRERVCTLCLSVHVSLAICL